MGADWLKFQIPPAADTKLVRELATFVSEQYPHGRWIVTPATFSPEQATRARWQKSLQTLQSLLLFPKGSLGDVDYWSYTALTRTPGMNLDVAFGGKEPVIPKMGDIDLFRVYVISDNPVFPIEWRDEAYRTILPEDLRGYVERWRGYIEEVQAGLWQGYLHDLYLLDRVSEEHQSEQLQDLVYGARESLTRSNAWTRKDDLPPVRDRILQANLFERLRSMREATPAPQFSTATRTASVTREQQERLTAYEELRQAAATQIKEWNRLVPQKWKVQLPAQTTFAEFVAEAHCQWLQNFFRWCEELLQGGYGLFLWA